MPQERRVHFVGIGARGMSALARVLLAQGIGVSGSDLHDGPVLEALRELGARWRPLADRVRAPAHRWRSPAQ